MLHVLSRGYGLVGAAAAVLGASVLAFGCDSSSTTGTTKTSCVAGELRCACYANKTCNDGLVCLSDVCVESSASGTGGTTSSGNGGATSSSEGGATVGNGGTGVVTGQGGTTVTSGEGGATVVGSGGATVVGSGGATVVGSGGATTVVSPVIDDFSTCDLYINESSGRAGEWYGFKDAGINLDYAAQIPASTSGWIDKTCGLYATGGCDGTGSCTHAGIGLQLLNGGVYSLASYSGVSVTFESNSDVYFILKTCNPGTCSGKVGNGYFGTWLTGGGTGSVTRNVSFASLLPTASNPIGTTINLSYAVDMQFTIGRTLTGTTGFGFAIHRVALY